MKKVGSGLSGCVMFKHKQIRGVDDPVPEGTGAAEAMAKGPVGYPAVIATGIGALLGVVLIVGLTMSTVDSMKLQAVAAVSGVNSSADQVLVQTEDGADVATDTMTQEYNIVESGDNTSVKSLAETTTENGVTTYKIKPGDTLSGISMLTGVSVHHLAKANQIDDVNLIYAGSSLVIPEVIAQVS